MSKRLKKKTLSRRDFLGLAGIYMAGAAFFFSFLGLFRMTKPRVLPEISGIFRIGKPKEFPPNTIRDLLDQKVRILSTPQGIAALSLECTHLGCIVKDVGNEFKCPCHGSVFDKMGKVKGGPAPRPLRWLKVNQAPDSTLLVNRRKEVQPGQYYKV